MKVGVYRQSYSQSQFYEPFEPTILREEDVVIQAEDDTIVYHNVLSV
jgi:hypothetical protein